MMFRTHLAFGILIGLLSLKYIEAESTLIFLLITAFFSIFPDIDEKDSKIGRRFKFLSYPIEFIFRHRGLMHTIYLPILIFLIFLLFNNVNYGFAALLGYLSHLFMDALTKRGIRPLQPLLKFRVKGFIKKEISVEPICNNVS